MSCVQKSVACAFFVASFLGFQNLGAQSNGQAFSVEIRTVFFHQKIVLGTPIFDEKGDSSVVQTLKFYLGNFEFLKNGRVVFSEKSHRLLDLEDEKSLVLDFQVSEKTDFDSLRFDLGVDSLIQISGAMGGDLDPTRGMFWTWQSGYIHFKTEGFHPKSTARNGRFEFHLGGYSSPFSTVRQVVLPLVSSKKMVVDFDLASFFKNVNWAKKPAIMSPGSEAARLSGVLAKSFRAHEN